MSLTFRSVASPVLLLVVAACAAPNEVPTPTSAAALPAPSVAPEPTPVMAPNVVPASTFVAVGAAPQWTAVMDRCSGANIDYVPMRRASPTSSRRRGPSPACVRPMSSSSEPTVTVVVRDGRPIWRGGWYDGGRGFLLGSTMACADAGIR